MTQTVKETVRIPVSVTLPKELLEWINGKVRERIFANRSHAVEVLILKAMKEGNAR